MRKMICLMIALILSCLLSGCTPSQKAADASPTPIVVEAPEIEATGELANTARALLAPYEDQLNQIALQCQNNLTYTIPGDMLNTFVLDARETGAQSENGRYQFIWRQSGLHTYRVSGQDVEENLADSGENAPEDAPMYQNAGDSSAAGGGNFDRSRAYDMAADLSQGTIEITDLLNNEITGHEYFSFVHLNGILYFVDAALDFAIGADGLEGSGGYLVAAGTLSKDRVEIVEYYVTAKEHIPSAAGLNLTQLLSQVTPISHLTARGDQVSLKP